MKLVKFKVENGQHILVNANCVTSITKNTNDTTNVKCVGSDCPFIVLGSIDEVEKTLVKGSKVDSIAGIMVILFIGIYILSSILNLF